MNEQKLLGNVGKEPEVRTLEGGNKVVTFSVATQQRWKDKATGEKKEKTTWHNIVAWGGYADVIEKYVKKGDKIYLSGRTEHRSWEKDGITRWTTEVIVESLELIGSKSGSSNNPPPPPTEGYEGYQAATQAATSTEDEADDLPF